MSYYILPKKNIEIIFDIKIEENALLEPFISNSLFFYLNDINGQIKKIINSEKETTTDVTFDFLLKIMSPYEFLFSKVPNTKISVSKLKPFSNTFYIFMEIIQIFNLFDLFEDIDIQTLHFGQNTQAIVDCLDMLREDMNDNNYYYTSTKGYSKEENNRNNIEFLTYELNQEYDDSNTYIFTLLEFLNNLLYTQSVNGIAIIKIDNIFYKPILEIIYILTSVYEKVYIIKPNICNIYSNERYIVCKNFIFNQQREKLYNYYLTKINEIMDINIKIFRFVSLLKNDLPYYFINKIDESNIIIGHQQLEFINQLIAFYKNKNKEEKIELTKKNNIQKCIQWCEKLKIPYNKFIDKVNIFLPISNEVDGFIVESEDNLDELDI